MQIDRITASAASQIQSAGGVAAAAALLNDDGADAPLDRRLSAYRALASQWREAGPADKPWLAATLSDSPFGRRVQSALNTYTRAAWAGADAAPPAPQAQALAAFDSLSSEDQQIVAAVQGDRAGAAASASPADFRARLERDFAAAQEAQSAPEPRDRVSLSPEALAHLDGRDPPQSPPRPVLAGTAARPEVLAAIAAYAKVAG